MIRFSCKCGKSIRARNEYAGRKIKCPDCDTVIRIPSPASQAEAPRQDSKSGARKSTSQPAPGKRGSARKRKVAKRPQPHADDAELLEEATEADELDELSDFDGYGSVGSDYDDYSAPALPSRRKKKKKPGKSKQEKAPTADDNEDGLSKKWVYTFAGIGGVVAIVLIGFVVKAMIQAGEEHSAAMAAPTEFKQFKHKHGALAAEYPAGWKLKSGGGTGGIPNWVSFENEVQEVKISIRGSVSGTAMSDIATTGGQLPFDIGEEIPDELDPVVAVHMFQKDKISAEYDAYEETDPEKIDSGFGEGRISDFEGKNTFSSEHGVRATLIASQFQYNVICKCPRERLEEYKPIFRRIISSIGQN